MSTLSASASLLTHSLAWALVHSLWQSTAIALCLFVLLKAIPKVNARIKYYLSFGALGTLSMWFANTWATQYQQLKGTIIYISAGNTEAAGTTTYAVTTSAHPESHYSLLSTVIRSIEHNATLILSLYIIGLCFMLLRFTVNMLQVSKLRTSGLMPLTPQYQTMLKDCKDMMGITRPVQLFLSNRINVPMMLGTLKPIILLPLTTINHLTTEQVEAILLHELAHIKRYDYLLNMIQTAIETILFFNPFVWYISAIIRREREHCCDDLVISSSTDPLPYAKALAILESQRVTGNDLVLAANGNKNHLFNRIKRIMEMKNSKTNNSQLTIIIVAVIAITFSMAMFTFSPSFAQKAKTAKSDTVKKSVYRYKTVTIDSNGHKTVTEKVSAKPIKEMEDGKKGSTLKVSIISDEDTINSPGTKVYTKVIADQNGRQQIIRTRKTINGKEEEIVNKTESDLYLDMKQMAEDLKDMAKGLVDAQVDINAVDWTQLKAELTDKLSDLDKATGKTIEKEIIVELENSKKAIKDAQKEIEKVRKQHITVLIKEKEKSEKEISEAERAIEQSKREIDKSKRTLEQSRKELEQSKRELEKSGGDEEGNENIMRNYEPMLQTMEQDGLIKRSGDYKIVKGNNELYINEEKQPSNIYRKYAPYFKGQMVLLKNSGHEQVITITD